MTCFVQRNGTAFSFGCDFGFLFQPTNDTVYCIQKILFTNKALSMAGCNQGAQAERDGA